MISLKTSVGIEIRRNDLLVACLQSNLSAGVFTHFTRIADFRRRDKADVRSELGHFFRENRLSRDTIVLGIPRRDLIVRHLDLPAEVADNLQQVIQYQVQSFEPTDEDKYCFDYVTARPEKGSKRLIVMVVMILKSTLDDYLNLLAQFGVRPTVITGSMFGLFSSFMHSYKDTQGKIYLLADVEGTDLGISAVRDGLLVYSNDTQVNAGQPLRNMVLSEMEHAAARMRLKPQEAIEGVVFNGERAGEAKREIADVIPSAEIMGNRMRFRVNPGTQLHVSEAVTPLGLAWSGMVRRPQMKLNLLPAEMRVRETRWSYIPAIALGSLIVLLLIGLFLLPGIQNGKRLQDAWKQIAVQKPRADRVALLRTEVNRLQKRLSNLENLLRTRDRNLEILRELTTLLPADSYLRSYQNQNGTITLNGYSPSAEALIPKLENSPWLKDVVQTGQVYKDQLTGKDIFTFRAKLEK